MTSKTSVKKIHALQSYKEKQQHEFNRFAAQHFKPGESEEECMGDFYFSRNNYSEALVYFRQAHEHDVNNVRVRRKLCTTKYNIGVRYIKQKDYENALRYMELVLKLEPDHHEARNMTDKLHERLRVHQSLENTHSELPSDMDAEQLRRFIDSHWVYQHHHFVLTGPAHSGKTRLACTLGHQVSRKGLIVVYHRLPSLLKEIQENKDRGGDIQLIHSLETADFLIFDDWQHGILPPEEHQLLREVITARYLRRATLFVAEMLKGEWHLLFGQHAVSDPLLNKVLYDAHKIHLEAEHQQRP